MSRRAVNGKRTMFRADRCCIATAGANEIDADTNDRCGDRMDGPQSPSAVCLRVGANASGMDPSADQSAAGGEGKHEDSGSAQYVRSVDGNTQGEEN